MTQDKWVGNHKKHPIQTHGWANKHGLNLKNQTLTLNNQWYQKRFRDADGCFDISLTACKTCKHKVRVELRLTFSQKQSFLLNQISSCFDVKTISVNSRDARCYVTGQHRLNTCVKPYFTRHSPVARRVEYGLWLRALNLVNQKAHLTMSSLDQIKRIKMQLTRVKSLSLE